MTAADRNAALQKRVFYPRKVDWNACKLADKRGLKLFFKHMETVSQPELTQSYLSSDVSNVHARSICSVALSTNRVICMSE
jgi:hypothetical protein